MLKKTSQRILILSGLLLTVFLLPRFALAQFETPPPPTNIILTPIGGTVFTNTLNGTNTNLTATADITPNTATGSTANLKVDGASIALSSSTTIVAGQSSVAFDLTRNSPEELQAVVASGGTVTVTINAFGARPASTSTVDNPELVVDYVGPTITDVSIPDVAMNTGDIVTATITTGSEANNYTLNSGTIAGFELGTLSKINDTTYTAIFSIIEDGTYITAESDIPISNLVLTDPLANPSIVYVTPISQENDPIDARSSAKAITSFDFDALDPSVVGVIDEGAKTVSLSVPFGTDTSALVPTIAITGESVSPASGVAQDFSSAVSYTVTAADTSTQAYVVSVTVAANSTLSGGGGSGGGGRRKTYTEPLPAAPVPKSIPAEIMTYTPILTNMRELISLFMSNMGIGMSNNDIKKLQKFFNSDPDLSVAISGVGSPGRETMYFGPLTKKAVQKFQLKYGVVSNSSDPGYGYVGPKTRAELEQVFRDYSISKPNANSYVSINAAQRYSDIFMSALGVGDSNSDVKKLQQLLNSGHSDNSHHLSDTNTAILPDDHSESSHHLISDGIKSLTSSYIYHDTLVGVSGVGSPGKESNYFGPLTEKAVEKFQLKHKIITKLTDDGRGYVGTETASKFQEIFGTPARYLLSDNFNPTTKAPHTDSFENTVLVPTVSTVFARDLSKGMSGNDVKIIQEILVTDESVYPRGKVTGYFGNDTEKAVKKFQLKHGLPQSGIVEGKVRIALVSYSKRLIISMKTETTKKKPTLVKVAAPVEKFIKIRLR